MQMTTWPSFRARLCIRRHATRAQISICRGDSSEDLDRSIGGGRGDKRVEIVALWKWSWKSAEMEALYAKSTVGAVSRDLLGLYALHKATASGHILRVVYICMYVYMRAHILCFIYTWFYSNRTKSDGGFQDRGPQDRAIVPRDWEKEKEDWSRPASQRPTRSSEYQYPSREWRDRASGEGEYNESKEGRSGS